MLTRIKNWYGTLPPQVRFAMRTFVVAVLTYAYQDLGDGDIDSWDALFDAVKVAGTYALLGIFTPLESFVGFNKPDVVTVPEDFQIEQPN